MTFASFVHDLRFRWMQPNSRMPRGYNPAARLLARLHWQFEILNTRLAEDESMLRNRLNELCRMPKMSTFAIGSVINRAVQQMPNGQQFVNVGVWNGFTLLAGMAGNLGQPCVGIDNFSQFGGPRDAFLERFERRRSAHHHFFDMDYQAYFRDHHTGPIGVYIYDGEHSYANQLQGLQAAEPFLAPGAVEDFPHSAIILIVRMNRD